MSKRTEQVGDEIQRILGEVVLSEMKDPRLGFVTITGVTMTPDLQRANVRVSIMGPPEERKATLQILERAKGFLRRQVGEQMSLRVVPQLVLHLDTSLDHAIRISEMLHDIEEDRIAHPILPDDESSPEVDPHTK
ncbi:MAG: 30S ribosome-binding factor RbfA [Herpetosiphon sp.]